MEHPPLRTDIGRYAEKISAMPPELIEEFIKDLPLHRVLELSLAPTAGPNLVGAIEKSPSWAGLFRIYADDADTASPPGAADSTRRVVGSRLPQLQRLFTALDHLAWNTRHEDAQNAAWSMSWDEEIRGRLTCFQVTSRSIQAHEGADFWRRLQENLTHVFTHVFFGNDTYEMFSAICMFLPSDITKTWIVPSGASPGSAEVEIKPWTESLQQQADSRTVTELADTLRNHVWMADQALDAYPALFATAAALREAKAAELTRLADMYERYPKMLKGPFAPQSLTARSDHTQRQLRHDAQQLLAGALVWKDYWYTSSSHSCERVWWYRFRYPHPDLVPFNWCLRLVRSMVEKHAIPAGDGDLASEVYPRTLIPDLWRCIEGLEFIHSYDFPGALRRVTPGTALGIRHLDYRMEGHINVPPLMFGVGVAERHEKQKGWTPLCKRPMAPHPLAELDWLESLCRCVEWAEANASTLGIDIHALQQAAATEFPPGFALLGKEDYEAFATTEAAYIVAKQLRADSDQCDALRPSGLPSLLALYLPAAGSPRAKEISRHLLPGFDDDLQRLMYKDLVKKLQHHIRNPPDVEQHADNQQLACDAIDTGVSPISPSQATTDTSSYGNVSGGNGHEHVIDGGGSSWNETVRRYISSKPTLPDQNSRICYICRMRILEKPHTTFRSMCDPCGEFNLAGSNLPKGLKLGGKTALVTGARVNLGFHTALRLLRCGAYVIATTRYPKDAYQRYRAEGDSGKWWNRLSVLGADFRCARDAFALVERVKVITAKSAWPYSKHLDILINNAAQTLTDSVEKETEAVARENSLQYRNRKAEYSFHSTFFTQVRGIDVEWLAEFEETHPYKPRVRGVDLEGRQLTPGNSSEPAVPPTEPGGAQASAPAVRVADTAVAAPAGPSSWAQSLSEIPYEDVISAHSINTFVPLILIRELLPPALPAAAATGGDPDRDGKPRGYVVNVSSREGIFETTAASGAKRGRHVHTNMSKAGLNMVTETEAETAWRRHAVAMNTVDPGYMSAAPECEAAYGGERPLRWEDGVGRVLWPIAVVETGQSAPVWGRFLKHYGAHRVDVRLGRG